MRQLLRIVRSVHTAALPSARKTSKSTYGLLYGIGGGIVAGGAVGGYVAFDQWNRRNVTITNPDTENSFLLTQKPPFTPSRSVKYPLDITGLNLTLYQYQTCPFCCKVRAMLDYFGISYNVVEVNPVLRTQLKWSEKYKKVPILIVETPEGDILQLNDSSMIVSALFSFLLGSKTTTTSEMNSKPGSTDSQAHNPIVHIANCYPTIKFADEKGVEKTDIMNKYFLMYEGDMPNRKEEILNERKWRSWTDDVYVHTLSPNIYRTLPEAVNSFQYFDKVGEWEKNFATWERYLVIYVGASAMWLVGKRLQKRHNLKKDVRKSLYEESDYWMMNIKKKNNGSFMGGEKPNLADLAVYGVLNSIEGCAAFRDLDANSKIVKDWYHKVQEHLGNSGTN